MKYISIQALKQNNRLCDLIKKKKEEKEETLLPLSLFANLYHLVINWV